MLRYAKCKRLNLVLISLIVFLPTLAWAADVQSEFHDAWSAEMKGNRALALTKYEKIINATTGSYQEAAIYRYRRTFWIGSDKYTLRAEFARTRDKINKTPLELAFLAQHAGISEGINKGLDERECYRKIIEEHPDSNLVEYAKLKLYFTDKPCTHTYKEFLPIALNGMKRFLEEHPDSKYVPNTKIRMANCYENMRYTHENIEYENKAIQIFRSLLRDYPEDTYVRAYCITSLKNFGVNIPDYIVKKAEEVLEYFATRDSGSLSKDFDIKKVDLGEGSFD